jgi:ATP-dependent RNA helicase DeaD
MSFESVLPALREALEAKGYTSATPVQAAVLEPALAGRDLLVSARTGSGKTVGFGLALTAELLPEGVTPRAGKPLVLVVAPTRELALQVERELAWLYRPAGLRLAACVGGTDLRRQFRMLDSGTHVVVGTPGRLCDLLDRGVLDLTAIRAIVLDEADEMLDLGFREELEKLLSAAPPERRTLMFSATLPKEILGLAGKFQRDAVRIAVAAEDAHADIRYRAVVVASDERENALVNVLRYVDAPAALVFVATRETVQRLHARLVERGFAAVMLSGELSQSERTRSLQALRDGRARVLVATDVAARGLDLPDLELVVHGDLPADPQVLVHRSGRTGRAGRKGQAVLLVEDRRRREAVRLLRVARLEADWVLPPTAAEVVERDQERLAEALTPTVEPSEEDLVVARKLLAEHDAEKLVAAMVHEHREHLPSPEDLPRTSRLNPEGPPERRAPAPVQDGVWFRVNVGRAENAHPHWIVPLICRRGKVNKDAIGAIRILDRETRFEIARGAADAFEAAARRPDRKEPQIRIQRAD